MKVTKTLAGYINPPPRALWPPPGKGIRCGTCAFFGGVRGKYAHHCSKVKGTIQAQGCCNLWSYDGHVTTSYGCGADIEDIVK